MRSPLSGYGTNHPGTYGSNFGGYNPSAASKTDFVILLTFDFNSLPARGQVHLNLTELVVQRASGGWRGIVQSWVSQCKRTWWTVRAANAYDTLIAKNQKCNDEECRRTHLIFGVWFMHLDENVQMTMYNAAVFKSPRTQEHEQRGVLILNFLSWNNTVFSVFVLTSLCIRLLTEKSTIIQIKRNIFARIRYFHARRVCIVCHVVMFYARIDNSEF